MSNGLNDREKERVFFDCLSVLDVNEQTSVSRASTVNILWHGADFCAQSGGCSNAKGIKFD